MIVLNNKTDLEISLNLLENIASNFSNKEIELVVVNKEEMHQINLKQRGVDKTTDVLSFPLEDIHHFPLGSIVINSDFVKIKAKEFNHSKNDEFALLFIQGLLHLCGYDHEKDSGEMREKEKEIIEKFNLPKSLIIRTES